MNKMTEGSVYSHLLAYALPLIFGNIFQLTYNAVDAIIIGKFAGEPAVAAVSSANPVMTIVILGVSGMCIGASVLMSEFFGSGDEESLKKEFSTMLTAGILFSLAVFAAGMILSPEILRLMKVPDDILGDACVYLRIIFFGFLFTFLYNALSAALRSIGDSRTPVRFLMISSVLNGCLDAVFIALLHMGTAGAGLATVIAEGVSVVLCIMTIRRKNRILRLKREEWTVDRELLKKTVKHGGITALQQCCQPIGKAMIQSCINMQGITMIAAFNAVNRVDDFACVPAQSISHGMMTCVAQNRGAGKQERVRETLIKGLRLEFLYGFLICITTLILKTPVMHIFAPEDSVEMIRMGTSYLTLMAFFYFFPGMTNGMQGYFRGIRKMTVTLIGTITQISVRVIVIFLLVPRIGMDGAAYACAAGWTMMLLFEVPYYFRLRHKNT